MTSRSNPDWLRALIAEEGESQLISTTDKTSLAEALTAAESPDALEPHRHAQLLAAALGSLAPGQEPAEAIAPSDAERRAAARLAENVETDSVASLLQAAWSPSPISPETEHRIRATVFQRASRPLVRFRVLWGTVAAAASVVLWFAASGQYSAVETTHKPASPLNYAQSRSTDTLFSEPFGRASTSERMDRIAQTRQRELRENRYLKWGVP